MLLLNTSKPSSIQNNVLKKLRRFLSVLFPWCKTSYIKLGFIHRLIYMPVNSYSCLRFSTGYSLLRCSVAQSLKKVPSRSTVCPFRHFIRLSLKKFFIEDGNCQEKLLFCLFSFVPNTCCKTKFASLIGMKQISLLKCLVRKPLKKKVSSIENLLPRRFELRN